MNIVNIVAGNSSQAKLIAKKNYLKHSEYRYIDNVEQIYGLRENTIMWYTGSYYMNKKTKDITVYCQLHNIEIIMK